MIETDGKNICEFNEFEKCAGEIKYDEEIFVIVAEDNKDVIIKEFCKQIFNYNLSEEGVSDSEISFSCGNDLENLLIKFPTPFTIVQEFHYIDRSFRDTYYTYFSNQHFKVKRYSRRLSFLKGKFKREDFFGSDKQLQVKISNAFMGACVINPLITGAIGRTLIDPKYLLDASQKPIYLRLSHFVLHIYGKKVEVDAFPCRMQDEETMRCAEVTLLNLLEYYANSYNDYRTVVPSEILEKEQEHSHERVLPSRGITYPILTKVLSEFGFSPRLYNLSSIDIFSLSQISQADELKRWTHYYIESGIPVALNLLPVGNSGSGHSLVCVGHGSRKEALFKEAQKKKWISWKHRNHCHPIINSADLYDDYVVIDDNQLGYQVRNFYHLSLYPDMQVENISVPLYKRMFLDAPDASAIIRSVLHHEQYGIDVWANDFLKPREDVIIRLFMASSHSLKEFRSDTLENDFAKEAYVLVPMPRFVWVCELYRVDDYDELMAFGEVVIDATSAPSLGHSFRSLIMMHYPNVLGIRFPEQSKLEFDKMVELESDGLFAGYRKNLSIIK